jgi:hypothetical protein
MLQQMAGDIDTPEVIARVGCGPAGCVLAGVVGWSGCCGHEMVPEVLGGRFLVVHRERRLTGSGRAIRSFGKTWFAVLGNSSRFVHAMLVSSILEVWHGVCQ